MNTDTIQNKSEDYLLVNLGADVISYILPTKFPLIMVDRIVGFNPVTVKIIAEKYISSNEPVFVGHFPKLKLWPGIYTIVGLHQSCHLLNLLVQFENAKLIPGLIELQKRQLLKPKFDNNFCIKALNFLENINRPDPNLFSLRIKLIAPVFAGCIIRYSIIQNEGKLLSWNVSAEVEGRNVAIGQIYQKESH
jgi:3-hydroxyacyl-[acyl-carrier-protein] dehydratase